MVLLGVYKRWLSLTTRVPLLLDLIRVSLASVDHSEKSVWATVSKAMNICTNFGSFEENAKFFFWQHLEFCSTGFSSNNNSYFRRNMYINTICSPILTKFCLIRVENNIKRTISNKVQFEQSPFRTKSIRTKHITSITKHIVKPQVAIERKKRRCHKALHQCSFELIYVYKRCIPFHTFHALSMGKNIILFYVCTVNVRHDRNPVQTESK
jgi:hypothetical protein